MQFIQSKASLIAFFGILLLAACNKDPEVNPSENESPNILLIIADDLGKDAINGFTEGDIKPSTPNIDAIRTDGISFTNLWVNPTCTPTRSSIITGKYGYRTDVKGVGDVLAQNELSLQKYISENTNNKYASALIGKWHLSGSDATVNPEAFGIDYYEGLIRGAVNDYYQWQITADGSSSLQNEYVTEVFTDLSIDWISQQDKPWFLWLAYNAPHTPFHVPPVNTHNQDNLPAYTEGMDPLPYYHAAIESMDFQIGRLLDNMPTEERENTVIIFIGDNGTPGQVAQSPYTSSTVKNSLYQGGINTPMFISGKGITRSGSDENLINSTDLFATISELAGINTSTINDSRSFHSLFTEPSTIRAYQYAELRDEMNDQWTIRNSAYKLIVSANGEQEMYHLTDDPYEEIDLLTGVLSPSDSAAKSELEAELLNIRQ